MSAASRERVRELCITVLGSGYAPFASGSWGSLAAVGLALLLIGPPLALGAPRWSAEALLLAGVALSSLLSVRWGAWALQRFGGSDPKPFVLDEFAGQWVALLLMPIAVGSAPAAILAVLGGQFFLFRLMDVLKPPPARQLESLPAGWGVLCDDLMAGVYANLLGQLVWRGTPALTWAASLGSAAGG